MLQEVYEKTRGGLARTVVAGTLTGKSIIKIKVTVGTPLPHQWWQHILRGIRPEVQRAGAIRTVDLFCGTGRVPIVVEK